MKTKLNKYIVLISCAAILISLVGCGTREWPPSDKSSASLSESIDEAVNDDNNSKSELENSDTTKQDTAVTTTAITTAATTSKTTKATTTTTAVSTTTTITEATTTVTTETAPEQSDGISFSITSTSNWESDGKTYYQYDCSINNSGATPVTSWTIEIPIGDSTLENSWSAKYEVSSQTLIITPDENFAEISANAVFSLGFQISTNSTIDVSQAKLIVNGATISPMQ